jgi:hypothetical protein
LHWNVELAWFAENVNVGVVSSVVPDGPESIDVAGATVSTVKERLAGVGSVLSDASVAWTSNVCGPSSSEGVVVCADVQGPNEPESTRHSKVEFGSLDENEKVGVGSLVRPVGPELIVVWGDVVSGGGGAVLNVAVTDRDSLIVRSQVVVVPVQAPLQPPKTEPALAVAVSCTPVPGAYVCEQSLPQLMPAGLLVTVPEPEPAFDTDSTGSVEGFAAVVTW